MIPSFSPREIIRRYSSIPLTVEDDSFQVQVTKYRCALAAYGGVQNGMLFKEKLFQAARHQHVEIPPHDATACQHVLTGKGSIQQIQTLLQYVAQLRVFDRPPGLMSLTEFYQEISVDDLLGVRGTSLTPATPPMRELLNLVCSDYVGLDCNGFVGNYLSAAGASRWNAQSEIRSFDRPRQRRTSLAAIQPYDVCVFPQYQHIMIIDAVSPAQNVRPDRRAFDVAESFGRIMLNRLEFSGPDARGIFTTHGTRQREADDPPNLPGLGQREVYVLPVGLSAA